MIYLSNSEIWPRKTLAGFKVVYRFRKLYLFIFIAWFSVVQFIFAYKSDMYEPNRSFIKFQIIFLLSEFAGIHPVGVKVSQLKGYCYVKFIDLHTSDPNSRIVKFQFTLISNANQWMKIPLKYFKENYMRNFVTAFY